MSLENIRQELGRVSYSDGRIIEAQLENGQAVVVYQDWQERLWHFEFGGVVLFRAYEFGCYIENVLANDDSPAISEAVLVIEQDGGKRKGYPDLLAVEFSGATVMMTVVFQTLHISSKAAT